MPLAALALEKSKSDTFCEKWKSGDVHKKSDFSRKVEKSNFLEKQKIAQCQVENTHTNFPQEGIRYKYKYIPEALFADFF